MIAFGIDSVDIDRFNDWHKNPNRYKRIFLDAEIDYCLSVPAKSAERFAVRFAVREAFFKALTMHIPDHDIPLLTVCRLVHVVARHRKVPTLMVDWSSLACVAKKNLQEPFPEVLISLTHTQHTATAFVSFKKSTSAHPECPA